MKCILYGKKSIVLRHTKNVIYLKILYDFKINARTNYVMWFRTPYYVKFIFKDKFQIKYIEG